MLIKEINVRGNAYKIMCEKDELDKIEVLTAELNCRINRISDSVSKKTSENMILILTMLELMDDVDSFGCTIKNLENDNYKKDATIKCMFSCLEGMISRLEEDDL